MLILSVWNVQVFIQFLSWNLLIQKLLWFCSQIYCNHWTFHFFCLSDFWNKTFYWYRVVFSLLSCQLNSWLSAWLYLLLFWADRTVHSCVYSSELVIVWVFSLFHQTALIYLFSDSVVDAVLSAVQCVSAFELEFELSCLLILSH